MPLFFFFFFLPANVFLVLLPSADIQDNNSPSVLIAGSIRMPFDPPHMNDISADDWRLTYGIVYAAQVVFLLAAFQYASCGVFRHTVYNVGSPGPGLSDLRMMNV